MSCLRILNDEGTIPDEDPLWTPSFKVSTLTVAMVNPLREVVIHSLS